MRRRDVHHKRTNGFISCQFCGVLSRVSRQKAAEVIKNLARRRLLTPSILQEIESNIKKKALENPCFMNTNSSARIRVKSAPEFLTPQSAFLRLHPPSSLSFSNRKKRLISRSERDTIPQRPPSAFRHNDSDVSVVEPNITPCIDYTISACLSCGSEPLPRPRGAGGRVVLPGRWEVNLRGKGNKLGTIRGAIGHGFIFK